MKIELVHLNGRPVAASDDPLAVEAGITREEAS